MSDQTHELFRLAQQYALLLNLLPQSANVDISSPPPSSIAGARLARAQSAITRIQYKPNFLFHAHFCMRCAEVHVEISCDTIDRDDPKERARILAPRLDVVAGDTEDTIIANIYERVRSLELHELQEFFRIDGQLRVDSHNRLCL